MFGQVSPRSFLWSVTLCVILVIGVVGCGGDDDDENDWSGTWAIESVNGQNYELFLKEDFGRDEVDVSVVTNEWTFNDDGTLEMENKVKIEGGAGGSEITATILQSATGTYSLSGSSFTLTLEITINFLGETETQTDEDAGTWLRAGNTLTLTSDDGEVIAFKKK